LEIGPGHGRKRSNTERIHTHQTFVTNVTAGYI